MQACEIQVVGLTERTRKIPYTLESAVSVASKHKEWVIEQADVVVDFAPLL